MGTAMYDAWVRLLEYMPLFLPMAVFMGTLLTAYNLTKSSESVIVSGAGLSPYQAARPFLLGAALIGIFATTVVNPYSVHISSQNITADHLHLVDGAIWLREASDTGYLTMRATRMNKAGDDLIFSNAVIFTQNKNYKLTMRITAPQVRLTNNEFSAQNAQQWDADGIIRTADWHS